MSEEKSLLNSSLSIVILCFIWLYKDENCLIILMSVEYWSNPHEL